MVPIVSIIIPPSSHQKIPTTFWAGRATFIPYSPLIHVKIPNNTVNIVRIEIILFVLIVVRVSETSNRDSVFSWAIDTRERILSVL